MMQEQQQNNKNKNNNAGATVTDQSWKQKKGYTATYFLLAVVGCCCLFDVVVSHSRSTSQRYYMRNSPVSLGGYDSNYKSTSQAAMARDNCPHTHGDSKLMDKCLKEPGCAWSQTSGCRDWWDRTFCGQLTNLKDCGLERIHHGGANSHTGQCYWKFNFETRMSSCDTVPWSITMVKLRLIMN